nr:DNA gyrase subunit A [Mycoplasma amphoriforme]WEI48442.1 DNA gyrase subunit A [Mycoplasma amphoriforme]WEI48443.1 DNA gyrase subunit A [Mycoplasma amphoriforme]WEI48444.1 DNA gyrase subunit A [Mycoplasma amphoriforme]WEI48445.1 DNA gyrase subunit A [Mycoplasma amphoriforme]
MKPDDIKNEIRSTLEKTVIKNVSIASELEESFLEYAMSVILGRSIPDARDGLKPVHRRILYAAHVGGMTSDKPYKKSARIVGDVMGKFHPHGDEAIYKSMVRMAQDFSMRYTLIDGHGNFGSVDGDPAAASRYTEARLSKMSAEMLRNIDKNTVDFIDNYDATEREPLVLPSPFPNLLANGASGIAVAMSTNIPPHNLSELIEGIQLLISNKDVSIQELKKVIKGPDFPTAGEILDDSGITNYFETGRGTVTMRAKAHIETHSNGKSSIIVTEIPYEVNKADLTEKIANLVKTEQIDGITDLRDESSREGIRLVIETRRDIVPEVLLNQLFKKTNLQTTFSVNLLSIVKGEPKLLNVKQVLEIYLEHQIEVLTRKTEFELQKTKERVHVLEGLVIATKNIDAIIKIIREASNNEVAMHDLMEKFALTEIQAKAILEMRLRSLSGLEREKLQSELSNLQAQIKEYESILANFDHKLRIISEQLDEINKRFGDKRKTEIIQGVSSSIDDEDLIPVEDVVVTMSAQGYLKRIPVDTYRSQRRGGTGVKGMNTYEDDDVSKLLICSTHSDLLLFTDKGKVYRVRTHQIPVGSRIAKGTPAQNIIDIEKDEKVQSLLSVDEYQSGYLFYCTKKGVVKRTKLSEFERINRNGKIVVSLKENDNLFSVIKTTGDDEIHIGISNGKLVRFKEKDVRAMGRTAAGVRGVRLDPKKDNVIGLSSSATGDLVLSIGDNGVGKLTDRLLYRLTKRGSSGVVTLKVNEKTGKVISTNVVKGNEDLLMISSTGKIIRIGLSSLSSIGRGTSGVKLFKLKENEKLQAVSLFAAENSLDSEGDSPSEMHEVEHNIEDASQNSIVDVTTVQEVKNDENEDSNS